MCAYLQRQARTARLWLLFFVDAVAAMANQALMIAQQLNELRQSDRKRLNDLGRMTGSAKQILDALFEQPIASINKIIELTGLTAATVGKLLDTLENKVGITKEITGQKRNRVFAYAAYIDILNQD